MPETPSNHSQARIAPEFWVERYGNYLYRYALSRLSDPETAQDLVQEALVAAVAAYRRFEGRSSMKTWLVAILKRKIVDHFRRMRTRQSTSDSDFPEQNTDGLFDENGHWRVMPNQWNLNPSAAYEQKEFMRVLYQCLAKLPTRLSDAFMLREFEEMSTQDICDRMGISEANAWVMLYRARVQLRSCLEVNWLQEAS
jgi:RNA polymerase sigma-70 factor (TIGR02943 family)